MVFYRMALPLLYSLIAAMRTLSLGSWSGGHCERGIKQKIALKDRFEWTARERSTIKLRQLPTAVAARNVTLRHLFPLPPSC